MESTKTEGLTLDGEEWFNVDDAATLAGITRAAIYKSIERGRLQPRTIVGTICVAASDIRRLWPDSERVI